MFSPFLLSHADIYIHMNIEKISLMSLLSSAGSYSLICAKDGAKFLHPYKQAKKKLNFTRDFLDEI